jgi:hypothetical protein
VWLFLFLNPVHGQIYNYEPINHFNFETNPAILASDRFEQLVKVRHYGAPLLSSNQFSETSIKASKYLNRFFTGAGISLTHTQQNDSIRYNQLAAGLAYRNVIFDKVYIKAGLLYKVLDVKAPNGFFTNYDFSALDGQLENSVHQNVNWSVSIASPSDFFHVSFGRLNAALPWGDDASTYFPIYDFINVGDFLKGVFPDRKMELMYTAFRKKYSGLNYTPWSHYIMFSKQHRLTRKISMKTGFRAGIADEAYYHFNPFIAFFNSQQIYVKIGVDLAYKKANWHQQYNPVSQISISKKF